MEKIRVTKESGFGHRDIWGALPVERWGQKLCYSKLDAMLFSLKSVNTVTEDANWFIGRHLLWTKWVLSPKILCWNLIPSVTVSGGRAFRWLGPEGGDLLSGISTLIKEAPERSFDPLLPCEDRAKWKLSMNQKVGSHHTLNLLVPWSWISQPPELWEINFSCW